MEGMSQTSIWLFVVLFGMLVILYFYNLYKTVHFLLKERPKSYEYKWKKRFPIFEHMKLTQENKKIMITIILVVMMVFTFMWLESSSNRIFTVLVATFVFSCLMLLREFSIHYYLDGEEMMIWSVHQRNYLTKEGKEITYKRKVKKQDILHAEKVKNGIIIVFSEKEVSYIKTDKKESEILENWIGKEKLKV